MKMSRSIACSFTTCMSHFMKVLAACEGVWVRGMLLYHPPHFVKFFALVTFFQALRLFYFV